MTWEQQKQGENKWWVPENLSVSPASIAILKYLVRMIIYVHSCIRILKIRLLNIMTDKLENFEIDHHCYALFHIIHFTCSITLLIIDASLITIFSLHWCSPVLYGPLFITIPSDVSEAKKLGGAYSSSGYQPQSKSRCTIWLTLFLNTWPLNYREFLLNSSGRR